MKLSQLKQIIREEAKRALNEGPALSDDANNVAKKGKDISQQISTLQRELYSLQTQYEKLAFNAGTDSINKIESALKSMFPNNIVKIDNKSSWMGGFGVRVSLKTPANGLAKRGERQLVSDLQQKAGLPKLSIQIVDVVSATKSKPIESFTVVLTQNYRKTALNFPNWSDAMRMAK